MIPTHDLEPGETYQGASGSVMELVKIMPTTVKVRMVKAGKPPYWGFGLTPGETRWMSRNRFCEWVQSVAQGVAA